MPSLRPTAFLFLATVAGCAMPAPAAGPILVELYQSQGCSSCPPADANLNAIADKPGVIALSFAVTYWDQLGWKDTFATPQFTQRQWDYARFNQRGNVATPQVWVNGRTTIVGNNGAEFAATIAKATSSGPVLSLSAGKVQVAAGSAPKGGADLWVARYDPRTIEVPIRAGESDAQSFALPASRRPGLSTAAFLQAGAGGPVLSAAKA